MEPSTPIKAHAKTRCSYEHEAEVMTHKYHYEEHFAAGIKTEYNDLNIFVTPK